MHVAAEAQLEVAVFAHNQGQKKEDYNLSIADHMYSADHRLK